MGSGTEAGRIATIAQPIVVLILGAIPAVAVGWFAAPSARTGCAIIGTVMVGAIAFDRVLAHGDLRRLVVEVVPPLAGDATTPLTFRVRIRNVGRPVWFIEPGANGIDGYVIERDTENLVVHPPARRGVVRYLYADVVSRGRLGIVCARRRYRVRFEHPVPVAPPAIGHMVSWPALHASVHGEATSTLRGDDLFRTVREYRWGDPRRDVHWPATAKHGTVMVQERDGRGSHHLRLVVQTPQPGPAAEVALGRARWIGELVIQQGWSLELHVAEPLWEPPLPPPLVKSVGAPPAVPSVAGPAHATVALVDAAGLRARLASAAFGMVPVPSPGALTRVIAPWGDSWA